MVRARAVGKHCANARPIRDMKALHKKSKRPGEHMSLRPNLHKYLIINKNRFYGITVSDVMDQCGNPTLSAHSLGRRALLTVDSPVDPTTWHPIPPAAWYGAAPTPLPW